MCSTKSRAFRVRRSIALQSHLDRIEGKLFKRLGADPELHRAADVRMPAEAVIAEQPQQQDLIGVLDRSPLHSFSVTQHLVLWERQTDVAQVGERIAINFRDDIRGVVGRAHVARSDQNIRKSAGWIGPMDLDAP